MRERQEIDDFGCESNEIDDIVVPTGAGSIFHKNTTRHNIQFTTIIIAIIIVIDAIIFPNIIISLARTITIPRRSVAVLALAAPPLSWSLTMGLNYQAAR